MDLSIIIVNHDTDNLTRNAIASVEKNTHKIEYEIIVVDNSSRNGTLNFKDDNRVSCVQRVRNNGFGSACNLGATKARGKYLLFLNSDTLVSDGCLDKCVEYIKPRETIGVLGAKTVLKDGSLDSGCKRGFPTPMSSLYYFLGFDKRHPDSRKYGAYHQTFIDENQNSEVDAVSGSCMMIPHRVFEEVGGFDEDYFMYGEDLDICYRIKQNGYRVVYFADAYIVHLKGQSGLSRKSRDTTYHFYNAMNIFYDKHCKNKYNFLVNFIVKTGIKFKQKIS